MNQAEQFYTLGTLMSLTGASGATLVITNGIKSAFDLTTKWIGLIVALCVTLLPILFLGSPIDQSYLMTIFVGVCNSFLVYATAGGANEAIRKEPEVRGFVDRPFLQPWF